MYSCNKITLRVSGICKERRFQGVLLFTAKPHAANVGTLAQNLNNKSRSDTIGKAEIISSRKLLVRSKGHFFSPILSRLTLMPSFSRSHVSGVTPASLSRCFLIFCVGVLGKSSMIRIYLGNIKCAMRGIRKLKSSRGSIYLR